MFDHMLVLVNIEKDNSAAIERAILLANKGRTEVTLLSLVYNRSLDVDYLFNEEGKYKAHEGYTAQCKRKLLPLQHQLSDAGIDAHIEVLWSKHKHQDIITYLNQSDFDLVVKTIREHTFIQKVFYSHNEWHLIRESQHPLLMVNPNARYPESPTITAAVDPVHSHDKPAHLDHLLVHESLHLAKHLGGDIAIFHSYDPIPPSLLTDVDSVSYQDLSDSIRQRHQLAFQDFMKRYPIDADRTWLQEGDIYETLPETLKTHQSPMVVMGAVSRSQIDQWLIGSTAERLLEVVGTDIFILKPKPPVDSV